MAENPRTKVSELLVKWGYGDSAMSLTATSVYGDDA